MKVLLLGQADARTRTGDPFITSDEPLAAPVRSNRSRPLSMSACMEWSADWRYFAETQTDFARPLDEVRAALSASIADVESAIAEFDSEDDGRMISFEAPVKSAGETVGQQST
jgi:hypothetical protein